MNVASGRVIAHLQPLPPASRAATAAHEPIVIYFHEMISLPHGRVFQPVQ